MDRQLLEMRRALRQRILKLERDVRFLRRRVRFPGSMQEVSIEDLASLAVPSAVTVVGSVDVDSGRWLAISEATLVKNTGFNGTEGLTVAQRIIRLSDGELQSALSMTNKSAYTANGSATHMAIPVTFVRAYSLQAPCRVQMEIVTSRDAGSVLCNVEDMAFQLLPF
jgi:hypothetical protein